MSRRRARAIVAAVCLAASVTGAADAAVGPDGAANQELRADPWLRPFRSDSIWNTAIGSEATYRPAHLPFTARNRLDAVYLLRLDAADPVVPLIEIGDWRNRCAGTESTGYELPLPPDFVIPPPERDAAGFWTTPNNGFVFLLPDGHTLHNGGAGARCEVGGPLYGYEAEPDVVETDLYGDGLRGGHGASRLSHLGGAIRVGELGGDRPIQHVLDLVLFAKYLYSDSKQTRASTYRWPATSADAYALDPARTDAYVGTDPELRMGSLLALPPGLAPADVDVETATGKALFAALQDYGAYVTEDAAWEANYLVTEAGAIGTFPWGRTEQTEFGRMVAALHTIANNGPDRIGGGGVPRRPALPPLPLRPDRAVQFDAVIDRIVQIAQRFWSSPG